MRTPTERSPFFLIQEDLRDDEWKLLVACVMLNQTSGKQVKQVIWSFFDRWPDAKSCVVANPNEIKELIRPLGFYNRRTKTLQRLSRAFSDGDYENIDDLYGVGKYASDSHQMFFVGHLVENVQDKKLKSYLSWAENRVKTIETRDLEKKAY